MEKGNKAQGTELAGKLGSASQVGFNWGLMMLRGSCYAKDRRGPQVRNQIMTKVMYSLNGQSDTMTRSHRITTSSRNLCQPLSALEALSGFRKNEFHIPAGSLVALPAGTAGGRIVLHNRQKCLNYTSTNYSPGVSRQ